MLPVGDKDWTFPRDVMAKAIEGFNWSTLLFWLALFTGVIGLILVTNPPTECLDEDYPDEKNDCELLVENNTPGIVWSSISSICFLLCLANAIRSIFLVNVEQLKNQYAIQHILSNQNKSNTVEPEEIQQDTIDQIQSLLNKNTLQSSSELPLNPAYKERLDASKWGRK